MIRFQRCYKSVCKNEREFGHNLWEYARTKLQPSDNMTPLFDCDTASSFFTQTYSDNSLNYDHLPAWVVDTIPEHDSSLFNTEVITPSLIKSPLHHCSMKSAPGPLLIICSTFPACTHHFLATLFNKILKAGTAPGSWGQARIKLIYKAAW